MKIQWSLIFALIFALIVAVFAVVNVEPVQVQYVFGSAEWPLILVILASALAGGIIIGSVGLFRMYLLQRRLKAAQKELELKTERVLELEQKVNALQEELDEKNKQGTLPASTVKIQTDV